MIATRNPGKVREIRQALSGLRFRISSLSDFPEAPGIDEDGKSFSENALKKARFYSKFLGKLTLADDSGLKVVALKGAPGVYSARYAGEGATDFSNNEKLLREMEGIPSSKRKATFHCSIAIVSPEGKEGIVEGVCQGKIGLKGVGRRGFGYDPLFIVPQHGRTMAQLTLDEKNKISHRGRALRKMRALISTFA